MNFFEELKRSLKAIDERYALNPFASVDLGMPQTLGLEKLSYTEKSGDEVLELAKKYLAAAYSVSFDKIESDYLKKVNDANAKREAEGQSLEAKLIAAEQRAEAEKQRTEQGAVKKGLARSSIKEQLLKDIEDGAYKAKAAVTDESGIKAAALDRQIEDLQAQKLSAIQSLDTAQALKLDAKIADLVKQEGAARDAVTKYNNTIDEREAAYLKTRQAAYDAAVKAKYEDDKRLMNLATTLGEDYVNEQKQREKSDAVKEFVFSTGMGANEAADFLSAFREQLGEGLYAELMKWIKEGM